MTNIKNYHIFSTGMGNIRKVYMDGQYQKFLVYGFKWVENTSQCFIENYNEDSDEGYFPKVDV